MKNNILQQITQDQWPRESGVIHHQDTTQQRVVQLVSKLHEQGICEKEEAFRLLRSADNLTNMGMWLTVHMTYAKRVNLSGQELYAEDFKEIPQGHTGGALNMVPAYVGYMLANALTGKTRAWLMGQGHCVAAIDAVNVLLRNLEAEQESQYPLSEQGLSQLCTDFYSYEHDEIGYPKAPLGSHVNSHTAGGILEGGYLGFASLQYMHMPLPDQELVCFLSDGAFEEQRGSDWATRWWRGEDTGLVMPIMIANGRRIEQRTSIEQKGGIEWMKKHLNLNGFDPIHIDGHDPAAYAWAIIKMSELLRSRYKEVQQGRAHYPISLPYGIAETVKGYGFPGANTNAAHNLPLPANPYADSAARKMFNEGASKLFVSQKKLSEAIYCLQNHTVQQRPIERDHCLRKFVKPKLNFMNYSYSPQGELCSPMSALDHWFVELVKYNPALRFRVANPDELRSNRFVETLEQLKHRVNEPENEHVESIHGCVITALNEEATISAVLANKQGVNVVVSYEAFAVKMLGAMRQEIIFARNQKTHGKALNWLSVPVLLSSHTWENGKNEISHQDPTLCEAWLQEMCDVAPVYFPFDANSAVAILQTLYQQTGRIAAVVVPKTDVLNQCSESQASQLATDGAITLVHDDCPEVQILCVGAFQLIEAQKAGYALRGKGIKYSIIAIVEPSKFRQPRDTLEADCTLSDEKIEEIIPRCNKRIFVLHTHTDIMTGVLRRLDTGINNSYFLGYENRGGTLDVAGMQLLNGQDSEHIFSACVDVLNLN